jgi:hypothetical protein
MTGRSLHDALLRVLSNGTLRLKLAEDDRPDGEPEAEWAVLKGCPSERLHRMARFLARHYYRERIIRLFRHVRALTAQTGRDPLSVLATPEGSAVLDAAILGTADSAECLLALIERFLLEDDGAVLQAIPYWRDLVRYQTAMFRAEAAGPPNPCRHPRRTSSAHILNLDWDLPAITAQLRRSATAPSGELAPTCLLIARSARRQVTAIRCSDELRRLMEVVDGKQDVESLARLAGWSARRTQQILQELQEIGAIEWNASD